MTNFDNLIADFGTALEEEKKSLFSRLKGEGELRPEIGRGQSAIASAGQGFLGTAAESLKGQGEIVDFIGTGDGENFRVAGQAVHDYALEKFPTDPELQGSFWWDAVWQGFGSLGAFLLGSAAGGAVGAAVSGPAAPVGALVGSRVAAATIGVTTGIAETRGRLQSSVDRGLMTEATANKISMLGTFPGLLEVFVPLRAIKVVFGATKVKKASSLMAKAMEKAPKTAEGAFQGVMEGVTEGAGFVGQEAIEIGFTDKQLKDIDLAGGATETGAGTVVGTITGFASKAIGLRRSGKITPEMTRQEIGTQILVAQAQADGLITVEEIEGIEKKPELLFRLAEARYSNREAGIEEVPERGEEAPEPEAPAPTAPLFGVDPLQTGIRVSERAAELEAEGTSPEDAKAQAEQELFVDEPTKLLSQMEEGDVLEVKGKGSSLFVVLENGLLKDSDRDGNVTQGAIAGDEIVFVQKTKGGPRVFQPNSNAVDLAASGRLLKKRPAQKKPAGKRPAPGTLRVRSRPDNVLWQERVALKHNEALISSLQKARKTKGITLEDLFQRNEKGETEFVFPISRDTGYLQAPSKLTDDLRIREVIAKVQKRFMEDIRTVKSLKDMSPSEKTTLLFRLDAEHAAKIDRILKKDDDKGESVRKEILREINEEIEPAKQSAVAGTLLDAVEKVIKGKPLAKQRDIVEGLLDTISDPTLRGVVEGLHRKMLTDFRRRPWSERVGMGRSEIRNIQEAMRRNPKFVTDLLKRKKEMRLNLVRLAQTLPREHRGSLLKIIAKVETAKEFGNAVQAIHDTQVAYYRAAAVDGVVKSAKRIEKNPRKAEAIELLKVRLDGLRPGEPGVVETPGIPQKATVFDPTTGEPQELTLDENLARKLTPHEENKLEIALDDTGGKFGALSDQHVLLEERWQEVAADREALTPTDIRILRYVFAESGTEMISRLGGIESIDVGDAKGRFFPSSRLIQLGVEPRPSQRTPSGAGFMSFLHEFGHAGYFSYLSKAEVEQIRADHRKLLETPSEKGFKSMAHEIIAEGFLSEALTTGKRTTQISNNILEYFASNPHEFFAQVFAQHVAQRKVPVRAMQKLVTKVMNALYFAMRRLIAVGRFTESVLPRNTVAAIEKVLVGRGAAVGLTLGETSTELRRREVTLIESEFVPEEGIETPGELPPVVRRTKTGQERVSIKNLRARLKETDPDVIRNLDNDLRDIIRRGMIEKGLYKKFIKFQAEEDAANAVKSLADKDVKSDFWKKTETTRFLVKLTADPVTMEGWLFQISKSDPSSPLYQIFFKNFEKPYRQLQRNNAETRKQMDRSAKKHLGMSAGTWKFIQYSRKVLSNGIQRSEAMWAYALFTDAGRREALMRDGIRARGNNYDVQESIDLLSEADKAFVGETKEYFQSNPFVEKAFKNFLLLHGYEAERSPGGWFHSRRNVERTRLADERTMAKAIITETDALKARVENTDQPFKMDGGYIASFYQVSDRLSSYAELGMEMYRAERLLNNPKFRNDFENRYGRRQAAALELYLQNILGFVGHDPTAIDVFFTYLPRAWLAGKIVWNPTSALRQTFSLFTAMGDNILDSRAILKSLGEQSGFNRGVGRRMRKNSGFAFMRLNVGRFAEHIMVLGEEKAPSKLAFLQNKSFILQRLFDDWALRVTYRAAEIMGQKQGLKGEELNDFVVDRFESSLQRNQASNSPLYASTLELEAKKTSPLRGVLALQRELNRLYNVPRRHVMTAMQHPNPKNMKQAMSAIFWTGIVNSVASVALTALRHTVLFGLPAFTLAELFKKYLQDLAGRWYLAGDATAAFLEFGGKSEQYAAERILPPPGAVLMDGINAGWSIIKTFNAVSLDETDPDKYLKSGVRRGQSRAQVEFMKAVGRNMAFAADVTGLPFWGLWYHANGLYNWQRKDYRMMVGIETEWARLRKDDKEGGTRGQEITKVKGRIARLHRQREDGLLGKDEARRLIIEELELDDLTATR